MQPQGTKRGGRVQLTIWGNAVEAAVCGYFVGVRYLSLFESRNQGESRAAVAKKGLLLTRTVGSSQAEEPIGQKQDGQSVGDCHHAVRDGIVSCSGAQWLPPGQRWLNHR